MPAGLPYVGWGARPDKNGQPPACIGQCNLNIGARKVGAAMKVYPNLRYGPKAKEQILQKWDPTTKSMVNIHVHECPPDNARIIGFYIPSLVSCAITIQVFNVMTNHAIFAKVYDSGGTLVNTPQNVGYNSGVVNVPAVLSQDGSYYVTLSNNLGDILSTSGVLRFPQFSSSTRITNVSFTSLSGAGNYSFYYDKGSLQDANLVAKIYSGQVSEYNVPPASTQLVTTSTMPANDIGTITLPFTSSDPYFRAYRAVFYSGATLLYETPYFYPDYNNAGVVSPFYPPTQLSSIPILIQSAKIGNENATLSQAYVYLRSLIDSRLDPNALGIQVFGVNTGESPIQLNIDVYALNSTNAAISLFTNNQRYTSYYCKFMYATPIPNFPISFVLTSNTFTITQTYPITFTLNYEATETPIEIAVFKSPNITYETIIVDGATTPSSSSGSYSGVIVYDTSNLYYVCRLTFVEIGTYFSQRFTMLAPQPSGFDIAPIVIPPAPEGTVNTITYASPTTYLFAANSNAYNRIASVAAYNTATSNFTMDYVAGPSGGLDDTTFGWTLTSVADANTFMYGYTTVNPSNVWTLWMGTNIATRINPVNVYSELSPPPKFRVILTTRNDLSVNLSVSIVNSNGTITPIANFDYFQEFGNFRASFGRHYDGNPTNILERNWTLSYPMITVG